MGVSSKSDAAFLLISQNREKSGMQSLLHPKSLPLPDRDWVSLLPGSCIEKVPLFSFYPALLSFSVLFTSPPLCAFSGSESNSATKNQTALVNGTGDDPFNITIVTGDPGQSASSAEELWRDWATFFFLSLVCATLHGHEVTFFLRNLQVVALSKAPHPVFQHCAMFPRKLRYPTRHGGVCILRIIPQTSNNLCVYDAKYSG